MVIEKITFVLFVAYILTIVAFFGFQVTQLFKHWNADRKPVMKKMCWGALAFLITFILIWAIFIGGLIIELGGWDNFKYWIGN